MVVRHRDDDVEFARMVRRIARPHEDGIGCERAARGDAFGARRGNCRRDDRDLLVAEQAALAGVRIEPGDRDARRGLAPGRSSTLHDAQRFEHRIEGDEIDRAAQRDVDRHAHRLQLVGGQQHAHRGRARQGLQHLGVAGEIDAGRGKCLLVDRRGDDRRHVARHRGLRRSADAGRRRRAGACIDLAERRSKQIGGQAARLQHRDATARAGERLGRMRDQRDRQQAAGERRGPPHDAEIAEHEGACGYVIDIACRGSAKDLGDDFGADAAGIAHRQGQRLRALARVLHPSRPR